MFVSHKLSPKKTFQKPNILRRKHKGVPPIRASPCKPSPSSPTVLSPAAHKLSEPTTRHTVDVDGPQGIQRVLVELAQDVAEAPTSYSSAVENADSLNVQAVAEESVLVDDVAPGTEQELVDVEAFLNGAPPTQYKAQYEVHTKLDNNSLQKWHIDLENAANTPIIEPYSSLVGPAGGRADAEPADSKCGAGAGAGAGAARGARSVACPARGGCARVFAARAALAAHLRDEHAAEDAPHGCAECGRRFFWAVGLRAHVRAHRPRGALLACGWPGCARAFRQPCRLREHARAHTGDRPYRCTHAGCAWAFRTASKLLRHARRHTGERRHRCLCGRAFRRKEHLRDHQAKCRAAADAAGAAPAASGGSGGSFTVRLAGSPGGAAGEGAGEEQGVGPGAAGERGAGGRAARTHCTWPLAHHAQHTGTEEARACAVRSDLFLAAAADDSQQMMAGVAGAGAGADAALEAASPLPPLGLLDLMQEELMYTDAVDESSFQVLLSDELG